MHFSGFSTSVSLPVVGVWCACTVRLSEDTSKMLSEDVTFVCHGFPPLCWGKLFHFICITAEMKNSSETACRLNTAQRHILGPKNLPHHTKSGLGSFCFLIFSDLTSCFSSKTNCLQKSKWRANRTWMFYPVSSESRLLCLVDLISVFSRRKNKANCWVSVLFRFLFPFKVFMS